MASKQSGHSNAVYGIVSFATLGAVLFGIDQMNFNGALAKKGFISTFCGADATCGDAVLQPHWYTWFVTLASSFVQLGAAFGALIFGPPVTSHFGRREATLIGCCVTIVGSWVLSEVERHWVFLVARLMVGVGVGIVSLAVPMYNAEVTPPHIRGMLGCLWQVGAFVGVLLAALLNAFEWMSFSQSLFLPAWPAIILGVGILCLPRSPRFALMKGKASGNVQEGEAKAMESLRRLYGSEEAAAAQLEDIQKKMTEQEASAPWSLLWTDTSIRRRIVIACMLQFLQQFTGVNVIIGYGSSTFNSAGVPLTGLVLNVITSACFNLGTIIGMPLVDLSGRRQLLMVSAGGCFVCMMPAAIFTFLIEGGHGSIVMGWLLVVCVCGYCTVFAMGFGPIPWLYPSEIYPMQVKEQAISCSVFTQMFFNFVIAFLVPQQIQLMKPSGTFLFYAVFCILAFVYVYFCVPETKGLTLEDMEELFASRSKDGKVTVTESTEESSVPI
eukprot:TRINITY_DN492_c3_g1_i6.p1 TRINITY_DN492_c3_g1~~TRINITY_DN492_c3_g1_i6.p1  ORF type:complete len:497 (+),score=99.95 TRINITY_DN492_c3_g1_i6:72-1562(+)